MLHGYLDLPTFTFFDFKNIWTGSVFQEFNYRIMYKSKDDADYLYGVIWLGKKCFDLIDPKDYICEFYEDFSPEGLETLTAKINEKAEEYYKKAYNPKPLP